MEKMGNCYAATEAMYHLLGGRTSNWKVMRIDDKDLGELKDKFGSSHWYLSNKVTGEILDITAEQFGDKRPDYSKGRSASFYPVKGGMSKRAKYLSQIIVWRNELERVMNV